MKSKSRKESGNMLLIVLIGIILFAALMFVLTRENRYDTGATENAAIQAQQIALYADKINGAVQNLMVQNHCLASQISFVNSTVSGYTNSNPGTSTKCNIFDQTGLGGGMLFQAPPTAAVDTVSFAAAGSPAATQAGNYLFEGNVCVTNAGTSCTTTGSALVFIMPWVTQAVCAQLDLIAMNSTTIPTVAAATFNGTQFTGTFVNTYTITTSGTTGTSGCFYSTSSPPGTGWHYYSVLQAN